MKYDPLLAVQMDELKHQNTQVIEAHVLTVSDVNAPSMTDKQLTSMEDKQNFQSFATLGPQSVKSGSVQKQTLTSLEEMINTSRQNFQLSLPVTDITMDHQNQSLNQESQRTQSMEKMVETLNYAISKY